MSILKLAAAAAALTAIAAPAAAVNLVTNGSFETTTYTKSSDLGGTQGSAPVATGLTGWTSGGFNLVYFGGTQTTVSANNRYNDPLTYFRSDVTTSPDGGNFVALDGDSSIRGALSQTITGLTSGAQYLLTFNWGGGQLRNRTGDTTEQLQVSFGGVTKSTPILNDPSTVFSGWKNASFTFTANGTSQVLSFLSIGTPDGQPPIAVLDGVSLTAVPEPATWALLMIGFGMVGYAARRRRTMVTA